MMGRGRGITACLLACATPFAAPLSAQDTQSGEAFTPAFTAEEDLDCAIYTASLIADTGAEMTPDSAQALASVLNYFIGRYEAQRGLNLTDAFAERYASFQQRNPIEIGQTCSVRVRAFAARLERLNGVMERLQPAPDIATEQPDSAAEPGG